MEKSNEAYRVKTNIGSNETVIKLQLNQDFDFLEVLSLKLEQENFYKFQTSEYGVIVGRVLANKGFGIPNAKVSVFIQVTDEDINDRIKSILYPYNTTTTKNVDGIRYNLFPNEEVNDCHQRIGTFFNKRLVLDNNDELEIFDKYYRYTTRTNDAGDFMIFGVPVGNQTVHVDLDMSDIGILSQRPRDLVYKGYNINQFENANQFKVDENLDSLSQVLTQDSMVYVYPFWGDKTDPNIAITRHDVQIQYTFESTCVFMGSVFTDGKSNGVGKFCIATENMGAMDELTSGNGTIEMIRKKTHGGVEEVQIQGNMLINGNGVWCYQIPMNLDYVKTDEYGNTVPTDNPDEGIATRADVRFRIGFIESQSLEDNFKKGKLLVPHNPKNEDEIDYNFGSGTLDSSFRTLFWNNVYSVKGYIPRIQKSNSNREKRFTGIKHSNDFGGNNPIPYNNIRVQMPFMYSLMCVIVKFIIFITKFVNWFITWIPCSITYDIWVAKGDIIPNLWKERKCLLLPEGFCRDMEGWYVAPGCEQGKDRGWGKLNNACGWDSTWNSIAADNYGLDEEAYDPKSIDQQNKIKTDGFCLTNNMDYMLECVEIQLAQEYKVISFDFYNDWINGSLYIPQWMREVRKKKSFLFGLIRRNAGVMSCSGSVVDQRALTQQCAVTYDNDDIYNPNSPITRIVTEYGCWNARWKQGCHLEPGRKQIGVFKDGGLITEKETFTGLKAYYYKPIEIDKYSRKRSILFATDLILLGSLNDCDDNGIPQAFTSLPSSTYQMPTNLALTNMEEVGFTYGINVDGTKCQPRTNGDRKMDTLKQHQQTPQSEQKRMKGQNIKGGVDGQKMSGKMNDTSYPEYNERSGLYYGSSTLGLRTELSGIDWGYTGPDQVVDGDRDKNWYEESLYLPGGHFLGISCIDSQTNIKSCVNLSRVCELGVMMSQRQEIPIGESFNGVNYEHVIPNGLISKTELGDNDVRTMFATMNNNGLKTKINPTTGRLQYDIKSYVPTNFNGELTAKLGLHYGKPNGGSRRYFLELNSTDYYNYRMGEDPQFLISNDIGGGRVGRSFPMYENSFYFYFGLRDGNTALDEFNKQYFAQCKKASEPPFGFTVKGESGSICGGSVDNKITVRVRNIAYPFTISLRNVKTQDLVFEWVQVGALKKDELIIQNNTIGLKSPLVWGDYKIMIQDVNGSLEDNVTILNPSIGLEYKTYNYIKTIDVKISDYDRRNFVYNNIGLGGYITISNITTTATTPLIVIYEPISKKYITNGRVISNLFTVLPMLRDGTLISTDGSVPFSKLVGGNTIVPLWGGNSDYEIYLFQTCIKDYSQQAVSEPQYRNSFNIEEPLPLTLLLNGGVNYLLLNKFNTGFFGLPLSGWDNLSSENSYDWEQIPKQYGGTNITKPIKRNRLSVIYRMKQASWLDGLSPKYYSTIVIGGQKPYVYRGFIHKEDVNKEVVNKEDANKEDVNNIILLEPTIYNKQQSTSLNLPTLTNKGGVFQYNKYDGSGVNYQPTSKSPFFTVVSDVNEKLPANAILSDDNDLSGGLVTDSGYSKMEKWFGSHFIEKPFKVNAIIWDKNDKLFCYEGFSEITDMSKGIVYGQIENAITINNVMGDCYLTTRHEEENVKETKYFKYNGSSFALINTPDENISYEFDKEQYVLPSLNLYGDSVGEIARVQCIKNEYKNIEVSTDTNDDDFPSVRQISLVKNMSIPYSYNFLLNISEATPPDYSEYIPNNGYREVKLSCDLGRVKQDKDIKVENDLIKKEIVITALGDISKNMKYYRIDVLNKLYPYPFMKVVNNNIFDINLTNTIIEKNGGILIDPSATIVLNGNDYKDTCFYILGMMTDDKVVKVDGTHSLKFASLHSPFDINTKVSSEFYVKKEGDVYKFYFKMNGGSWTLINYSDARYFEFNVGDLNFNGTFTQSGFFVKTITLSEYEIILNQASSAITYIYDGRGLKNKMKPISKEFTPPK